MGTGPGTLNLGDATLYLDGGETLDDDVVTMTSDATISLNTTYAAYLANGGVSPAQTVTFGAAFVVDLTSGPGYINQSGDNGYGASPGDVTLVNQGKIDVQGVGATLQIYPQIFDNSGTLSADGPGGSVLYVYSQSFTNTGTISVASGDTFELGNSASQIYTTAAVFGGAFEASAGTFQLNGTLDNSGQTLKIGAANGIGTFYLAGVVSGGVIEDSGSGLAANAGILDDVTYKGTLALSSGSLVIEDGITLETASGGEPGALTLGSATVDFEDTQTLDDAVVTLSSGSTLSQFTTQAAYAANGAVSPSETLTFGPSLVIDMSANSTAAYIDQAGSYGFGANPGEVTILNQGVIGIDGANSTLYVYPQNFVNAGTLVSNASGGSTFFVYSDSFTNTGTIDVASDDTFELGNSTSLTYTTGAAFGGTIHASAGTIELNANLDTFGATLKIGAANGIGTFFISGNAVVSGGMIVDSGSGFASSGGTLDDVIYQGALSLASGSLYIKNGLTLETSTGGAPGALNIGDATVYFEDAQTFDNAVVTMTDGAAIAQFTSYAAFSANGNVSPSQTLTFGAALVIDESGVGHIGDAGYDGYGAVPGVVTLLNKGKIDVDGVNATLTISAQAFVNSGVLISDASSGGDLLVASQFFTNAATIDVSSGDYFQLGNSTSLTYKTGAALGGTINASAGTIELHANLDNFGATLKIGAANGIGTFLLQTNAAVSGGVIQDSGSGLASNNGVLTGLTYEGALNLTSGGLFLGKDVVFTGASGTGAGAVNLSGATLYYEDTQTVDAATITLSGGASIEQYTTQAAFLANGAVYPDETLTFGAHFVIEANAGANYLTTGGYYGDGTTHIVNNGVIRDEGSGTTLYIEDGPGTFLNNGTLEANGLGAIHLFGSVVVSNISADKTFAGDVLTGGIFEIVDGAAANPTNGASTLYFDQSGALAITTLDATVDLTGAAALLVSAGVSLATSLRDVGAGGVLNLAYDAVSATAQTFNSTATSLTVDGAINLYGSVLNVGSLVIRSGGAVTAVGEAIGATSEMAEIVGPVSNSGVLVAGVAEQGAPLSGPETRVFVNGALTNTSGVVDIAGSTILELSGAAKGGQVVFENNATTQPAALALDATVLSGTANKVTSVIAGFQAGDVIDLTKLSGATFKSFNGTTLSFTVGSTTDTLTLSGVASSAKFSFASDGATGTDITVACYARGTRIATAGGEAAIETLRPGDFVRTASGALRPVVWVGRRMLAPSRHPDPRSVWPVRVRAHAFGDQMPARDLDLSPGHNIAALGALAPAAALVNGVSVTQVEVECVEYWHVELDAHDVILAEGLPAESYLDTGNRAAFVHGGEFGEAFTVSPPKHWSETCLPLALSGPKLAEIKALLLGRLAAQGFEFAPDSDPHLLADGERIEPLEMSARRLAFVVPEGRREITLASRTFIPAHSLADSEDPRTLGLSVGRLEIDGETLDLEGDLGPGWHAAERTPAGFSHRWTSGAVALPAGARMVIVDLVGEGRHWRRREESGMPVAAE